MDKTLLLDWLIRDAVKNEKMLLRTPGFLKDRQTFYLNDLMGILKHRMHELPPSLPEDPEELISVLRKCLNDRVTDISLILSQKFPDRFLYYRVSTLEEDIFSGLNFFADIQPEFNLPFDSIGEKGFDRYLMFNQALLQVSSKWWSGHKYASNRMMFFLYRGLGELFQEAVDLKRYWIMATSEYNFKNLDEKNRIKWSGRKEMKTGDLVFMYRMSPRKAITDLYRVLEDAWLDPWWDWPFQVKMERVCSSLEILFSEMRKDPVLSQWGVVRKQFQGSSCDKVPHAAYNRLIEYLTQEERIKYGLSAEELAPSGCSGFFATEAEFEEKVIMPLLERIGVKYSRQHPCRFYVGSQPYRGRVDFYVSDERGPLTLFENKLRIRLTSKADLDPAVEQGRSYALMLGLPSFVVAAPEGIWAYKLKRSDSEQVLFFTQEEVSSRYEELYTTLRKLRK